MAEQTDWYERGCSRGCRNSHTRVWGWCELAEKPEPTLNLHMLETLMAEDGFTSIGYRQATAKEAEAEIAKFRPEPTWREVKLAAHRAGYRVEQATLFPEGHQRWLITDKDDNHPWHATVQHSETRGWQIDLHGPYGSFNAYPPLVPGRVLAAARLVGLVGAS